MKRKVIAAHEKTVLYMVYGSGHRMYYLESNNKVIDRFGSLIDAKIAYNKTVPAYKQLEL